jgi:hypothetical protein
MGGRVQQSPRHWGGPCCRLLSLVVVWRLLGILCASNGLVNNRCTQVMSSPEAIRAFRDAESYRQAEDW